MNSDHFVREFGRELSTGSGALFIGAGISKPSGLSSWASLIEPLAASRLDVPKLGDADLIQVAQYIVNASGGNRGALIHHLRKEFSGPYLTNSYHRALVQTQVSTVWTTNYDLLLEQAFREAGFSVDVKSTDDSVSRSVPNHEIEIIKMHGSIDQSRHEDLVITAEDYEDFKYLRPAMSERLRSDLLSKSFLFLGYSYRDPNIHSIMVQARRLSGKATRQHFLLGVKEQATKNDEPGDLKRRQKLSDLWAMNLRRFGIEIITLEDYSDLERVLVELARQSRGPTVYAVGSHEDKSNHRAQELGKLLAKRDRIVLIDGQSEGVGRQVITAFVEERVREKHDVYKHLKIFPNPYAANPAFANDASLIPILKTWRAPLVRATQVFLCFDGGMGTTAELELAQQSGCVIIPVRGKDHGLVAEHVLTNDEIMRGVPAHYAQQIRTGNVTAIDIMNCIDGLLQ